MNVQMSYNFTRILPKIGSSTSEKKNISTSKMTLIQQQNASIDGPGFLSLPIDTRPSNGYEHSSRWSRHDGGYFYVRKYYSTHPLHPEETSDEWPCQLINF